MNFKQYIRENSTTDVWGSDKVSDDEIKKYVKLFKTLKDEQIIKPPYNDIYMWLKKFFGEFKKFVDEHNKKRESREESKEKKTKADVVFENSKCIVYLPKTYEASAKLGTGTKWCISARSERGCRSWEDYVDINGVTPYYIISKSDDVDEKYRKIAVIVMPSEFGTHKIHSVWSADNKAMYDMYGVDGQPHLSEINWIWDTFDINRNIFKTVNTFKSKFKLASLHSDKSVKDDNGKEYNLYRIQAIKDFGDVREGEMGGYVSNTNNIGKGNCWVYDKAMVYGDGFISGNAKIKGNARIHGDAHISGDSVISGDADIAGDVKIVDKNIRTGRIRKNAK